MRLPTFIPAAFKGLFRRPATRRYPAEARPVYAGARGAVVNDAAECILCGLCARRCPTACIEVVREKDGPGLWAHDPFACVLCGTCAEVCPTGSLVQTEDRPELLLTRGRTELHPEPKRAEKK